MTTHIQYWVPAERGWLRGKELAHLLLFLGWVILGGVIVGTNAVHGCAL